MARRGLAQWLRLVWDRIVAGCIGRVQLLYQPFYVNAKVGLLHLGQEVVEDVVEEVQGHVAGDEDGHLFLGKEAEVGCGETLDIVVG